MDLFYKPHRLILQKLIDSDVKFIVVGGYAVNFHGFNRPTGDIDLWLKPSVENQNKFIKMLETNGFEKESINYIKSLDFSNAVVFCMGTVPARVDFLTKISGVNYNEADKLKILADVKGLKIPILHINHLILSKISNERLKDKLDVEELQKIQDINNYKR
jgi:hypothetical protein